MTTDNETGVRCGTEGIRNGQAVLTVLYDVDVMCARISKSCPFRVLQADTCVPYTTSIVRSSSAGMIKRKKERHRDYANLYIPLKSKSLTQFPTCSMPQCTRIIQVELTID